MAREGLRLNPREVEETRVGDVNGATLWLMVDAGGIIQATYLYWRNRDMGKARVKGRKEIVGRYLVVSR